jgi:hypothetical protein
MSINRGISVEVAPDIVEKNLISGVRAGEVVSILTTAGWSQDEAADLVYAVNRQVRFAKRYAAKRRVWIGAAILIVGTTVTIASFFAVGKIGFIFIAYGAVIYGAFDVIMGLVQWVRNRDPERPTLLSR